ncbi:MAG: SRPBCC family protein [Solirubrobacterales bacterium]|nr:SRPBCC family protein [Solirubrobacterales bacterium]
MFGAYETIENRPALRFERRLSHPVEAVWRAITDPGELEHWFPSKVEVGELRAGAEMTFTFESMPLEGAPTTMTGRVTEFDPPRRFSFSWGGDHLRFELEPGRGSEEGCLLRLTVLLDQHEKAARDAAGWHVCLDRLEGSMAGRETANEDWRARYEEYQRRGLPAGAPIPAD